MKHEKPQAVVLVKRGTLTYESNTIASSCNPSFDYKNIKFKLQIRREKYSKSGKFGVTITGPYAAASNLTTI